MPTNLLSGLQTTREQLLRQYVMAKGYEKTQLLTRIMELDEQIKTEKKEINNYS